MEVEPTYNDQEPFVPPPCMAAPLLTNGHGPVDVAARDDGDVADEESVTSTPDVHTDNDELTAERAAEKMIERRIQVVRCLIYFYISPVVCRSQDTGATSDLFLRLTCRLCHLSSVKID